MRTILLIGILLLTVSCTTSTRDTYQAVAHITPVHIQQEPHPGEALMDKYCSACHNATTAHDKRLAPPMIAVKNHYLRSNMSKEEFVSAILDWTSEPSEDKARMYGAVERFGVMPYQSFPEDSIKQIAEYMFEYDLEEPDWFKERHMVGKGHGNGPCANGCSGNCSGMGKGMKRRINSNKS